MTENSPRPAARLRSLLAERSILFHDGRAVRRVTLKVRTQVTGALAGAALLGLAGFGAGTAANAAVAPATQQRTDAMQRRLAAMEARVATIRHTAQLHAARVDQRQALLTAAITGKGEPKDFRLASLAIDPAAERVAADAVRPLVRLEGRQTELAAVATRHLQDRYRETARTVRRLGLEGRIPVGRAPRGGVAMGGPLVEATGAEARADLAADAQFRSLFMTWKKLDRLEQGVIAIPSVQPVSNLKFTSNFGIRSDPFRGTAAMHAGVDIPGPVGTPIYATADGIVSHAGRQGGYGNMVELNHGKGIATRYGHLSRVMVANNTRVTRGQLIALMGSTGRSTGPHLHYEVRIDGHAVNPVPFLTTADYLLAAQDRAVGQIPVSTTGPAPQD